MATATLESVFVKYATDDVLNLEGIVAVAEEVLELDLSADVAFYVLAWKLKAQTPTTITHDEWTKGMTSLGCKIVSDLKNRLASLRAEIAVKINFQDFYKWLFMWSKESKTARFIKKDAAVGNWELIFTALPTGPWEHGDDWLEFMNVKFAPKTITEDLWVQLFIFIATPGSNDLSKYDEAAAWPAAIDQFVAWKVGGKK